MTSQNQNSDKENPEELRTPIVSVLGHVDHGKTTLLDRIRGTTVVEGESGAITQHIGSTVVPINIIQNICESISTQEFEVPGLLFIDTPGHQAFTTLRSRGGSLSDIAVLVIDINEGFQPQTKEAIEILNRFETPFVIAANKIDKIPGWSENQESGFEETYNSQSEHTRNTLDERIYELVGELHDEGFNADRYDRVQDFKKSIGIVPVSAETGEGLPDLLMVLVGLAQRFLKENLELHASGPGRGTVVEVKEEKGFGTTVDVLLYDGVVRVGDKVIIGGEEGVIDTEIRALLKPRDLEEIRVEKDFEKVDEVSAAAGVKVAAPDLDSAVAGAPFYVVGEDSYDEVVEEVKGEMEEVSVETDDEGIVVNADTLGSVEALAGSLSERDIPVMRASEGDVSRRDVVEAETAEDRKHRAVIAFNVDVLQDARDYADEVLVEIFEGDVIYRLLDEYEEWMTEIEQERAEKILDSVVLPGKIQILHDHVFRQSNPAVVGVEVLGGTVRTNVELEKDGEVIGNVKGIQSQGEDVDSASEGEEVSVAIDGPTVGRQIDEGDVLYTKIPEKHAKALESEFYDGLNEQERETLNEYLDMKREVDPFWGK